MVGCWWACREIELATTRCKQISFAVGPGCGECEVDMPVSKADVQALGKKRKHVCTCDVQRGGGHTLCPVKVMRMLWTAAQDFAPEGAEEDLGLRPLWPTAEGKFPSKGAVTLTFQKLAEKGGMDTRITGQMCVG